MLLLSDDNGASWNFIDLKTPEVVHARYSSFPSANVGFITSGCWPVSTTERVSRQFQHSQRIHYHVDENGKKTKKLVIHPTSDRQIEESFDGTYQGIIQRSTDGFKTFQTVYTNTTYCQYLDREQYDVPRCELWITV